MRLGVAKYWAPPSRPEDSTPALGLPPEGSRPFSMQENAGWWVDGADKGWGGGGHARFLSTFLAKLKRSQPQISMTMLESSLKAHCVSGRDTEKVREENAGQE